MKDYNTNTKVFKSLPFEKVFKSFQNKTQHKDHKSSC